MARRTLDSARIIITGASSGIGLALAKQLGQQGAQLLVTASAGGITARTLGGNAD